MAIQAALISVKWMLANGYSTVCHICGNECVIVGEHFFIDSFHKVVYCQDCKDHYPSLEEMNLWVDDFWYHVPETTEVVA